jgi:hypothetical protein
MYACRDWITIALAVLIPMRDRAAANLSDNILKKQWSRTKTIVQNH